MNCCSLSLTMNTEKIQLEENRKVYDVFPSFKSLKKHSSSDKELVGAYEHRMESIFCQCGCSKANHIHGINHNYRELVFNCKICACKKFKIKFQTPNEYSESIL